MKIQLLIAGWLVGIGTLVLALGLSMVWVESRPRRLGEVGDASKLVEAIRSLIALFPARQRPGVFVSVVGCFLIGLGVYLATRS